MKKIFSLRSIAKAAVIAALYVVLTLIPAMVGASSSALQLRISEMLCVLPYFTISAVPGLTIGCLIANILSSGTALDVILGTLATLIGALLTYSLRKNAGMLLCLVPPTLANVLTVPIILRYGMGIAAGYFELAGLMLLSETLSCLILGLLLGKIIEKNKLLKKELIDEQS